MTPWLIAYLASAAFTTAVSVHQLQHGCIERNPFAPSSMSGQIAFKGGATAGYMIGIHVATSNHMKPLARTITIMGTVANVAVGVHDATQHCGR